MHIVGFGGTSRLGSTTERLVGAVLDALAAKGASVRLFGGAELATFPHYDPGCTDRSALQSEFVDSVRAADGVVIGSPGYHGGVSGMVKNAIDLLEDTARDDRTYLTDLPVGLIVTAGGWQAGGVTLTSLRSIVHAMRGWPTPLGIAVNTVAQTVFDDDGRLVDPAVRTAVELQAAQIHRLASLPRE